MMRQRFVITALLALGLSVTGGALAQSDAEEPETAAPSDTERGLQRRPGVETERPALPEFEGLEDVPLELPNAEALDLPQDRLSTAPLLTLQRVRVNESTVLDPEEVGQLSARYLDRQVSAQELQNLRAELTGLYVERGYVTSGVLLPDQRVTDGTVNFQAVEGTLSEVEVRTSGRLRPSYVERRLALADGPLNVADLRDDLRTLHSDPLIERLDSRLLPGSRRGEARLVIDVQEARPYQASITAHNNRAPSVGSEWVELNLVHRNLLGFGDRAQLGYGTADGLDDIFLSYAVPVFGGATLAASYTDSEAQVVEEPFSRIDIRSESQELALDLVYPWRRFGNAMVTFTATVDHRESQTSLLGIPFSFSPGVQDGRAEVTALRLTADWTDRRANQVLALRGRVSVGIDALDATANEGDIPDGEFVSLLAQAQWARRFESSDHQLILRADLQKTLDGLLPLEKFSIGGRNSVRGYRQNLMVRDNGWVASAEYRIPAFRDVNGRSQFQWTVFADAGRGWNETFATPDPKSIASVGAGFLWEPLRGLRTEFYLAHGFEDVNFSDEDPQDRGIHLLLRYEFF
ncbi:MAG: ShlB/FhaC/HecB family hemolysin secretion/activation protein [Pseudomonadota bacterium]